jgi:hypothetical protein
VVIEPDIGGMSSTDFGEARKWVARGRAAAMVHSGELEAIADSARRLRGPPAPRRPLPTADSVFVSKVSWSRVSEGADAIAEGAITVRDSTWVTQRLAAATAARVFATGRFDQVSYRLVRRDGGHDLVFDLTEADRDQLGVGVRYDTPRGVALLASARVADIVSPGSTASISARLGEVQQLDVRDVLGEGLNAKFLQTYRLTSTRTTLRTFDVPGSNRSPVLSVQQAAAQIERTLVSGVVVGGEIAHEWSRDGAEGADEPYALHSHSLNLAAATVSRDNLDRVTFPTRGTAFFWRSEAGGSSLRGARTFARHVIDAEAAMPVFRGFSLVGTGHWGDATGVDLPLHDWFFLGGSIQPTVWRSQFVPFWGMDPASVAGRSVRVVEGGAQFSAAEGLVVAVRGSMGKVFDPTPDGSNGSRFSRGGGLVIGREFAPGPVSISFGSRSWKQQPVVEMSFGARF